MRTMRRVWTTAAVALVVFAMSACDMGMPRRATVVADPEAGEIPFRFVGPGGAALVVSTYVNGEGPYDLILDTGATYTCLSETLAQELELPERRLGVGVGVGVGGMGRVRMVQLDSLRVGGAMAIDMPACVLDLAQLHTIAASIHGLLGLNFLRNYHVALDFERNVLVLRTPGES